ncbi:hypothetical protein HYC85_025692 [Camellia sinensis]|uniref:RecA family profile 2 domain-containing protein n=1 Tax=Camellia sinensis TaxID=4442 RepID=A0A7J7GFR0_CAMSI|nr:hypothetical protein HYC85_025692 [Camellia sinensis]
MVSFRTLFVQSLRFNAFTRPLIASSEHQSGRKAAINWVGTQSRFVSSAAEVSEFESDELHDDVGGIEKDAALRLALSRLASDFGRESMLSLKRFFRSRHLPVISTGSLKLDLALGIGGLPKGRIVEIYGQEASGKTTLALHIIKEAQKFRVSSIPEMQYLLKIRVVIVHILTVENAMDPSLAEAIGVNTENLLISQPDSAENLLCMVDTLTKSGSIDVIVVDSVRSKVRSVKGFGHADEVTCGGNALQFYAAIRMKIQRKGLLKTEDKVTGLGICVHVMKNKLAPPMKKAELGIKFGRGICCESEVLELACDHGIIMKEGNNFFIEGEVLKNKQEAERYLAENNGVLDKIVNSVRSQLFGEGA